MLSKLNPNNWLRGVALAYIFTFVLLLVVALILRFTDIAQSQITLLNNLVFTASIVFSSAILGRKVKDRGWLNGAILGFLYYFIIVIINLLFNRPLDFSMFMLVKLIIATALGAIGGMIGINLH